MLLRFGYCIVYLLVYYGWVFVVCGLFCVACRCVGLGRF